MHDILVPHTQMHVLTLLHTSSDLLTCIHAIKLSELKHMKTYAPCIHVLVLWLFRRVSKVI